jgi:hypothetical protein
LPIGATTVEGWCGRIGYQTDSEQMGHYEMARVVSIHEYRLKPDVDRIAFDAHSATRTGADFSLCRVSSSIIS